MRSLPIFVLKSFKIMIINFERYIFIYLKYGLFANGENGHGTAIMMIISATLNHTSIVLNFEALVSFLLAEAEPTVIRTIATSISEL